MISSTNRTADINSLQSYLSELEYKRDLLKHELLQIQQSSAYKLWQNFAQVKTKAIAHGKRLLGMKK